MTPSSANIPESLAASANTTKTRTAPAIDADSGRPITRWKVESVRTRSSAAGCGGGAPGGGGTVLGAVAPPFVSPAGSGQVAPAFRVFVGAGLGRAVFLAVPLVHIR